MATVYRIDIVALNIRHKLGRPAASFIPIESAAAVINRRSFEVDYVRPSKAGVDLADRTAFWAFEMDRYLLPLPVRVNRPNAAFRCDDIVYGSSVARLAPSKY
jgi:hypothetical protein